MMKLPLKDFEWMTEDEISHFDINSANLDGDTGYIIECDLKYPKKLHSKHSNLPLAPEVLQINFENLSPYAKRSLIQSDGKTTYSDVKLTATFHDRNDYVLHCKNLKLYLDLGMKLKKIKRILKFTQDTFLAKYIQKCTEARQNSATKFESSQFKKLANCVYGKTMQNVRDYITVKLHTKRESALKAIAKHTYKNHTILSENLVQTNHFSPTIIHDKPIAIGVSILELSKNIMFDFWYNKMTKNCPSQFDLGMSDTDSFLFKVTKPDEFWYHIDQYMDYSNYPKYHIDFDEANKAQLGYFKNELGGELKCTEYIGLRPKCYSMNLINIRTNEISEKKICKGLGRAAITNRLRFKQYKKCLKKGKIQRHDFATIRSTKHKIKTIMQRKKALSHFDCKRWLFDCGIHSVPYGSKHIQHFYNICPNCFVNK